MSTLALGVVGVRYKFAPSKSRLSNCSWRLLLALAGGLAELRSVAMRAGLRESRDSVIPVSSGTFAFATGCK